MQEMSLAELKDAKYSDKNQNKSFTPIWIFTSSPSKYKYIPHAWLFTELKLKAVGISTVNTIIYIHQVHMLPAVTEQNFFTIRTKSNMS